jgi:hypothetical protein
MKTYQCHKRVQAFKIASIEKAQGQVDPGTEMSDYELEGADGEKAVVNDGWLRRHKPDLGGYFVRYDDGYESFSPSAAFEDGYTEVPA